MAIWWVWTIKANEHQGLDGFKIRARLAWINSSKQQFKGQISLCAFDYTYYHIKQDIYRITEWITDWFGLAGTLRIIQFQALCRPLIHMDVIFQHSWPWGGSCGGDVQVPFHVMFPMPTKAVSPRTCGCSQCCLPWHRGNGSSSGSLMNRIWAFGKKMDCCPCAPGSLPWSSPRICNSLLLIWLPSIFKELSHQLTF